MVERVSEPMQSLYGAESVYWCWGTSNILAMIGLRFRGSLI